MEWTQVRVDELRIGVDAGRSFSIMAAEFGCSRNAAIGKAHRLGFKGPNSRNMGGLAIVLKKRATNEKKTRITKRTKKMKPQLIVFDAQPDEPEPLRVSLLDLGSVHCHWVCDKTDDNCLPTYCGHPTISESSWCPHHYRRVYA